MSLEKLKEPNYAILFAIFMTVLVAIESLYPVPWAPYFLIYAILAIVVPLIIKSYRFRNLKEAFSTKNLKVMIIIFIITILVVFILDFIYIAILSAMNLVGDPFYDLSAALEELANAAAIKFNITPSDAKLIYAIYVLIWAPIGEEIFYRGYLYGELKKKYGIALSAIISTFLFGIRHSVHFLFLLPNFTTIAALYWAFHAFIFGLIMVYTYEKTDTLYIPMILHFLTNLVQAGL